MYAIDRERLERSCRCLEHFFIESIGARFALRRRHLGANALKSRLPRRTSTLKIQQENFARRIGRKSRISHRLYHSASCSFQDGSRRTKTPSCEFPKHAPMYSLLTPHRHKLRKNLPKKTKNLEDQRKRMAGGPLNQKMKRRRTKKRKAKRRWKLIPMRIVKIR
jgi:hypothetical protein